MNNKEVLNLGSLIAKLRKEKGFSQRKFAQISGLSNTTISRIENGETLHPDLDTLKLLAAHLDYPEAALIELAASHEDSPKQKGHSKLKFLHYPVRSIKRYSSVSTSLHSIGTEEVASPIDVPPDHLEANAASHYEEPQLQSVDRGLDPETEALVQRKVTIKGMRLITLRMERNITQKELADALGLDKTLISQYEGEIIKPDFGTISKLSDFFGVEFEYFTGEPKVEIIGMQEPITEEKQEMPVEPLNRKPLRPEYIAIAEEIQEAGIEAADVRAFIDMIKKYRS